MEFGNNEKRRLKIQALKREVFNKKLKSVMMYIVILFEIIFFVGIIYDKYGAKTFTKGIAVVNFNKEVTSQYVQKTIAKIDKVLKDPGYKEILFIMNSPGGSPAASEDLASYLKHANKIKHVTMYVQDIAASGGYYIASAIKPLIVSGAVFARV